VVVSIPGEPYSRATRKEVVGTGATHSKHPQSVEEFLRNETNLNRALREAEIHIRQRDYHGRHRHPRHQWRHRHRYMREGPAMTAKHPEIIVRLDGAGNDFRIIDHVTKALRKAGVPVEEIEQFCDEAMSGDDRDLLRKCGQWVTLVT